MSRMFGFHLRFSVFSASLAVVCGVALLVTVPVYAASANPSVKRAEDATSSLSVELSIYWKGEKRPGAKMRVVLLDADPEIILRDAGLEATPGVDLCGTYQFASTGTTSPRLKKFRVAADKAMKPHIIATAVTDSQGRAHFTGLKPGTAYLRGTVKIDRGLSFVNNQFELKPGENTLVL